MVDAVYDTDLDITWLRNASVNGMMNWHEAMAWADAYSLGGHSDWRLPTVDDCGMPPCPVNEMAHLFRVEGISAGSPGVFQNVPASFLWSGTENSGATDKAWAWHMGLGYDSYSLRTQSTSLPLRSRTVTSAWSPSPKPTP